MSQNPSSRALLTMKAMSPEGCGRALAAFHEFQAPLYRYALRRARGNEADAGDAVQHAFLKLCQCDGEIGNGGLRPWLYKVCRNYLIDLARRGSRLDAGVSQDSFTDTAAQPDGAIIQNESQVALMHEMAKLPDLQQELLRLHFEDKLSYSEIEEISGLTENQIRHQIHTALVALRRCLCRNPDMKGD